MTPTDEKYPDVVCPHCGAHLSVDEPDDFEGLSEPMQREEECCMVCPECNGEMSVWITLEPTYGTVDKVGGVECAKKQSW